MAAQTESVKTRIMNRANIGPTSFSRYFSLCQERQLIVAMSGGYTITPQAEQLLESINQVLNRASQLRVAVDVLNQTARSGGYRLTTQQDSAHMLRDAELPDFISADLRRVDRRSPLLRRD